MKRTIIIGDVHGCIAEFSELLRKLAFVKGEDRLILVGDLMDRGPDPVACVKLARECGAEAVLSNHDEKHIRFRKHEAVSMTTGRKNPMRFPAEKSAQNAALSDQDIEWFRGLPLMLEAVPGLVVVHAGLEPAFPANEQPSDVVIRVRYVNSDGKMVGFKDGSLDQPSNTVYWTEQWKGPESVIYGHAVHSMTEPRIDRFDGGACYGIDTGCAFGGSLCAMVLAPGWGVNDPAVFVQVRAAREYLPKHRRVNES
jgi:hypothetical protein